MLQKIEKMSNKKPEIVQKYAQIKNIGCLQCLDCLTDFPDLLCTFR